VERDGELPADQNRTILRRSGFQKSVRKVVLRRLLSQVRFNFATHGGSQKSRTPRSGGGQPRLLLRPMSAIIWRRMDGRAAEPLGQSSLAYCPSNPERTGGSQQRFQRKQILCFPSWKNTPKKVRKNQCFTTLEFKAEQHQVPSASPTSHKPVF